MQFLSGNNYHYRYNEFRLYIHRNDFHLSIVYINTSRQQVFKTYNG